MKKIYIGADHAGFKLKEKLKKWLDSKKINYEDVGNLVLDMKDDYPDYAIPLAEKVVKGKTKGILLCGSAEGVCIAANKVKGALAVNPHGLNQTKLAREHEGANIICIAGGGSVKKQASIPFNLATKMITAFLNTPFSKATRHKRRIAKIKKYEN